MRNLKITTLAVSLLLTAACDYTGDWLFAGAVEGVPGVIHLNDELDEFDTLVPADITSVAELDASIIYAEVGPTGTTAQGGVTFTFEGTGSNVCVWVDPELLFWNQSVAASRPSPRWTYPDNVFDDGDLDLYAGLSSYYNGSPGETVGDFEVRYEDSLGNPVEVAFSECSGVSLVSDATNIHSGRGAPESCTLANTLPGVNYLVLLQTWSTPLNDDRLAFGLIVANGSCSALQTVSEADAPECVILGESIDPNTAGSPGPWVGFDEDRAFSGSVPFEQTFCDGGARMSDFCVAEAADKDCEEDHCFCGDPSNTPTSGSF